MSEDQNEGDNPDIIGEIDRRVEFIGPIEYHMVKLYGRLVPDLTATPLPGGKILLSHASKICIEISLADAQWMVPFIANCIVYGMGYQSFPEYPDQEPIARVHMPRLTEITSLEGEL